MDKFITTIVAIIAYNEDNSREEGIAVAGKTMLKFLSFSVFKGSEV